MKNVTFFRVPCLLAPVGKGGVRYWAELDGNVFYPEGVCYVQKNVTFTALIVRQVHTGRKKYVCEFDII